MFNHPNPQSLNYSTGNRKMNMKNENSPLQIFYIHSADVFYNNLNDKQQIK